MVYPTQVPVSRPLAEFGSGFANELLQQGYAANSACLQMNLMAHLSRWLADEGLDVHWLSDTEVEKYLRAHRGLHYGWATSKSKPRTFICTQILSSKSVRSRGRHRCTVRPVAIDLTTRSWLFSRRFDYADSIAASATCNKVGDERSA